MESTLSTLPEEDSEDLTSIIRADSSEENSSTFRRYAVPPQFDGNSSEEEELNAQNEEKGDTSSEHENTVETIIEDSPDGGYQALVADEFGEFVSSEAFGDYYSQENTSDTNFLHSSRPVEESLNTDQTEELKSSDALSVAQISSALPPNANTHRVSIPPLDAGECNATI